MIDSAAIGYESLSFVCPACKGGLKAAVNAYMCLGCNRQFPVLFGIPDFRLRPDRYLSLEDEREKARRLYEFSSRWSFRETLEYYYQITEDVSAIRAEIYIDNILNGVERMSYTLCDFAPIPNGSRLLDAGCGAGHGLIAAHRRFDEVVGIDIALRWLVIAKKRLDESGLTATLICADIETPPFEPKVFSHVLAADLLEHVQDAACTLKSIGNLLREDGLLWLSTGNRRWLGPHPSTGVWAAGLIPASIRKRLFAAPGYDPLRFVRLLTPSKVRAICASASLSYLWIAPRRVQAITERGLPSSIRRLVKIYAFLSKMPVARAILVSVGPVFQLMVRRNQKETLNETRACRARRNRRSSCTSDSCVPGGEADRST